MPEEQKNLGGRPPNPDTIEGYLGEIIKDVYKIVRLSRASTERQIQKMEKQQKAMEKGGSLTLSDMAECAKVFADIPAKTATLIGPLVKILNDLKKPKEDSATSSLEEWQKGLMD